MDSTDVDPSGATAIGGEDRFEERTIREAACAADFAARYRLGPRLGRGATGVVFRATGPAGDVAIKFLHSSAIDEYRERFAREGRFLAPVLRVLEDVRGSTLRLGEKETAPSCEGAGLLYA